MRVLSLGAGVQSSTLLLMACEGELQIDHVVFADTQWEPESVYDWLRFLEAKCWEAGITFYRLSTGSLRADALGDGRKFATMPLFVKKPDGSTAMLPRQCTNQYKIAPIRKWLRDSGATASKPADLLVGISLDEYHRMRDVDVRYYRHVYPLIEKRMTRWDCVLWLGRHGYPQPQKSACVACPYRDRTTWRELTPAEWQDAVDFDRAIRNGATRGNEEAFVHRQLVPLEMVDFSTEQDRGQLEMFDDGCSLLCPNDTA